MLCLTRTSYSSSHSRLPLRKYSKKSECVMPVACTGSLPYSCTNFFLNLCQSSAVGDACSGSVGAEGIIGLLTRLRINLSMSCARLFRGSQWVFLITLVTGAIFIILFTMCNTPQCWVGCSRIMTILRMSLTLMQMI